MAAAPKPLGPPTSGSGPGLGLRARHLLLCVDERPTIPDLVAYAQTVARRETVVVRVVHVIDYALPGGLSQETVRHAKDLVDESVFELQMAGLGAEAVIRQSLSQRTAATLIGEAAMWSADEVVLGAPRRRLFGFHVRERVLRSAGASAVVAAHLRA
jgi:K+-sensing histidine kinase KdpD